MTNLAFVDTETTGVDPDLHEVWEVGIILADHDAGILSVTSTHHYDVPCTLVNADPMALTIGGYYRRHHPMGGLWPVDVTGRSKHSLEKAGHEKALRANPSGIAAYIAPKLAGRHLVGAVPSFDAAFLSRFLRANGQAPAWHYHLIDVEPLVAGYLRGLAGAGDLDDPMSEPPWKSTDLAEAIGVTVAEKDRHTAVGDARWALRQYAAVYGLEVVDR